MKRFMILLAVLVTQCASVSGIAAARDATPAGKFRKIIHRSRKHERSPPAAAIPQEFAPPQEAFASFPQKPAGPAVPPPPSGCDLRLAKLAEFQRLPLLFGPGECGAADAVVLRSVTLPDQGQVAISPPATLRCTMAEEVAQWLRQDVARAAQKLGGKLRELENAGSYECRGRDRLRAATMSEHARANALDVRAVKLTDGKVVGLTDVNMSKDFRESLRASACARFTTVLGPGADPYHEEHIHLDLDQRRGGYRLCEWDVRTAPPPPAALAEAAKIAGPVPLPRPRPTAADAAPRQPLHRRRH